MSACLRLQSPPSHPPFLDSMTVCILTSSMLSSLTRPLTLTADDPEFDTFAWYCTEAANNSRAPQLPYSAHDTMDQNTGAAPSMNQDAWSYPRYAGAVLPQSQFWPYQASANAQFLDPTSEPIPIAYAEYAANEQVEMTPPIPTSAAAKRPRGQISLDETSIGDEQMTPHSATSGSSAVRSPPELKAPRRTSSKSRAPASAAAAHSNRTPHNLIERRYRHKLQSELDNLTSKIPGWETENPAGIDIENAEHALKSRSKASAIAAAAKHIESLERDNESKDEFVKTLQGQIEGLQKLVHCDDCAIMRCLQDSRMTCRAE
jgi:hypothetical protein